jgi:hypothetical protein
MPALQELVSAIMMLVQLYLDATIEEDELQQILWDLLAEWLL